MRHILLATDGSEGAARAADLAGDLAKATGAKLSILTIGEHLSRSEAEELAQSEGGIGDALDLISAQILKDAEEHARRAGASDVHIMTGWGNPAARIIEIAQREHVDVIMVGRRGRGRLAGLLLGSVSQKLTTLAPCTVVVVP